jgi:hypothetical protein
MLKTTFKETKTHVQPKKKTIRHIKPHKIPLNPLNPHESRSKTYIKNHMSLAPHGLITLILDLFDQCVDGLLSEGILALLAPCGGKRENPVWKFGKNVC